MLKKMLLVYIIGFVFFFLVNVDGIEIVVVDFDWEILKLLGVDFNILYYFFCLVCFLSGEYLLIVLVNGEKKGNIVMCFDENGDICFV